MILPKCVWVVILKQANWFPARGVNRAFRQLVDTHYIFEQKDYKSIAKRGTATILNLYEKQYKKDYRSIFYKACKFANWEIINLLVSRGAIHWNIGLYNACRFNYLELVFLMIGKGANDWNEGLVGACRGGHLQLVQLMVEKGANMWNSGLSAACHNNKQETVLFMIQKGAKNCANCENARHFILN